MEIQWPWKSFKLGMHRVGIEKNHPLQNAHLFFFFFALQPELKIRKEDFSHFTLQHPSERTRITWCAKGSPR